jgi:hypothetical protein
MKDIYFMVTIDTEEDNWGYTSDDVTVENIQFIPSVQKIFDSFGIRPVYLCTTPVVENPVSSKVLKDLFTKGKCDIGTHLHPWTTPPIEEKHTEFNSNLKNLPYKLVKTKLYNLTRQIYEKFDYKPTIFRAGRWALGENVVKILVELGYSIDTSITPFITWRDYGEGADFSSFPFKPYFINLDTYELDKSASRQSNLLEIPVSIGFNRYPFFLWSAVDNILRKNPFRKTRAIGILQKTGLLRKIWLSPEFNNSDEMFDLSKMLLKKDVNLFNFTFHSTSLKPGLSPFVKTDHDLKIFLKNIENYLNRLNSIGKIISVTSKEVLGLVETGKIKCFSNSLQ